MTQNSCSVPLQSCVCFVHSSTSVHSDAAIPSKPGRHSQKGIRMVSVELSTMHCEFSTHMSHSPGGHTDVSFPVQMKEPIVSTQVIFPEQAVTSFEHSSMLSHEKVTLFHSVPGLHWQNQEPIVFRQS